MAKPSGTTALRKASALFASTMWLRRRLLLGAQATATTISLRPADGFAYMPRWIVAWSRGSTRRSQLVTW